MNTTQVLFSVKHLATRWGVSSSTVWRWSASGLLANPIKINGITRWLLADVEAFDLSLPNGGQVRGGTNITLIEDLNDNG